MTKYQLKDKKSQEIGWVGSERELKLATQAVKTQHMGRLTTPPYNPLGCIRWEG